MKKFRPWKLFVTVIILMIIVATVTAFILRPKLYRIPTEGMLPTLRSGDCVVTARPFGGVDNLPRGIIVVYTPDRGPGANTGVRIQRIAAIAGDRVEIINGELHVNGTPLPERNGLRSQPAVVSPARIARSSLADVTYPLVVPAGHVFLLGDNYANSLDSRYLGTVPTSAILKTVRRRVLPFADAGPIK